MLIATMQHAVMPAMSAEKLIVAQTLVKSLLADLACGLSSADVPALPLLEPPAPSCQSLQGTFHMSRLKRQEPQQVSHSNPAQGQK